VAGRFLTEIVPDQASSIAYMTNPANFTQKYAQLTLA
jgi:hypothetical protein